MVSEIIRVAAKADPRPIAHIARASDCSESSLHQFMHGRAGLRLPVLDRVVEVLGLTLVKATEV